MENPRWTANAMRIAPNYTQGSRILTSFREINAKAHHKPLQVLSYQLCLEKS